MTRSELRDVVREVCLPATIAEAVLAAIVAGEALAAAVLIRIIGLG